MKAVAVKPGNHEVGLVQHPEPTMTTPTQVRLRMLEVGVCGTDKEICSFQYGTPPTGSDYLVIGHESLARVVEVGPGVTRVKVGDLVVPTVRRPCPHASCKACREGRQDFCYTGDFTERGIKQQHGYMTEFVVDEERYMNVIPPGLREVGVLVEPLTIAEKALLQVMQVQMRLPWSCDVTPGRPSQHCHRALVLGAGPVGLLGAMALVNAGFDTYVYSRSTGGGDRAAVVGAIGGTFLPAESVAVDQLAERIGNIDLIYEATGASSLSFDAMRVLGTNGVFVFTGVPGRKGPIQVDTDLIMRNLVLKNQVVFGTVNAGRDAFEASIGDLGAFMKKWPDAVRALITGRFPMEAGHDLLCGQGAPGIKNIVTIAA